MSNGLGSGDNGEFTFLDTLSLISFFVGMSNLGENLRQSDKQDLQKDLTDKMNIILNEIHSHLQQQDDKIDLILKELNNDSR